MALPKRKKWTEEEELALITKYSELSSDGILSRLRTREKKYRPIADSVNSLHHSLDPSSYPFLWSWKDASTKVQNMRHQYLLVKQKLISASSSSSAGPDWSAGVSIWPNFLHYRHVFGDHPLPNKPIEEGEDEELVDENENLGLELGFDEEEEEGNGLDTPPPRPARRTSKKKKKKRRDLEEREWEERTERRREEWRRRVEVMLTQHRADMAGIQAQVVAEQQAVISQLLGVVPHLAAAGAGSGIGNQGTVVPGESRVEDQQFIMDDG